MTTSATRRSHPETRIRILVATDADAVRSSIRIALADTEFEVTETASGDADLKLASDASFGAIVTGSNHGLGAAVPGAGLGAGADRHIPVLQLLPEGTPASTRAAWLEAGAAACLTEPVDAMELRATLRSLLRARPRDARRPEREEAHRYPTDVQFRRFIETTHESVLAMDTVGTISYANARLGELLGRTSRELVGMSLFDFMPPEEAFAARTRHARLWRGISDTVEMQMLRLDGSRVDVVASVSPIVGSDGTLTGVLAMLSNVTARKAGEGALAEALRIADLDRRRLEATLDAIPVGVWLSDVEGRITHSNPAATRIWAGDAPHPRRTQYQTHQYHSSSPGAPATREGVVLARVLATAEPVIGEEMDIERLDGTRGHVLMSAAPVRDAHGRVGGAVIVNVDITEQREQMRERELLLVSLERERSRLAEVFERAPTHLAVLRGPEFVYERVNPAYRRLVGERDLLGKPVLVAIPEIEGQGVLELLEQVRATGEPHVGRQMPLQLERSRGEPLETRFIDCVYLRLTEPDGGQIVVSHGVDVTEHVLANEQIRRNKRRLREQFEKLPVPTFLWEVRDDDFVLLEGNEAARVTMPGFGGTGVGQLYQDLFPELGDVRDALRRALKENVVIRLSLEAELGVFPGRRRLELTIGPQQPDRVLVHAVDTTERTELEAQLRQAQKMDAIGRLAGGIAHDFNNLLTVIDGHSSFLLESLGRDDPQREDADAIHAAGKRAASLTRQLLAFSRKQLLKPAVIDINAIVEDARRMLVRLLGEHIEIVTDLASELPTVRADPMQMDQVVLNLAVNARDAMPSGGRLTMRTFTTAVTDAAPGRTFVAAGEYVVLSVRDEGTGMDTDVQARLFEPFFTTKEPGKGTGLGLATVYGIVKQSEGYILCDSALGVGTVFDVYLPIAKGADAQEALLPQVSPRVPAVTILLIEDEIGVREVATRLLLRAGHRVLGAEDGEAALAIAGAFNGTIDLVISDVVMPGTRGVDVVDRLRRARPALKSLFMSGYTDDVVMLHGIVSSSVTFLQKPFSKDSLLDAVQQALNRGSTV